MKHSPTELNSQILQEKESSANNSLKSGFLKILQASRSGMCAFLHSHATNKILSKIQDFTHGTATFLTTHSNKSF